MITTSGVRVLLAALAVLVILAGLGLMPAVPPPFGPEPAGAAADAVSPGDSGPGVSADPLEAAPGTSTRVRGSGWVPGGAVQVQICGANGTHGSADCDTERAVTAMVASTGTFETGLTVGAPPAACPCVVRAGTLPGAAGPPAAADAPFTVLGHRVAPVRKEIAPVRADLVSAELVGGGERSELFGGRPRRTLVLRIRNAGSEPIVDAPLVVGWGAGDEPDLPLETPKTGTLAPGRIAVYRIPVELPPASFGRFVVGGRYAGSVPFTTAFSTYPWGLLAANLLAALLLLLGVRLALGRAIARRRRRRRAAARGAVRARPHPASSQGEAEPPPVEVAPLVEHLVRTAQHSDGGARVVDRAALAAYLDGHANSPVDVDALNRFLALDRFADARGPADG